MQTIVLILLFVTGIIFAIAGAYTAFVKISRPKKKKAKKVKKPKTDKTPISEEVTGDTKSSPLNKVETRESYTELECEFEESDLKEKIINNVSAQDKKYIWN